MSKKKNLKEKIKLGIVGCGYWGPNLIRNFIQIPGIELKIACDLNKDRLVRMKTLYPFLEVTRNFNTLLQSDVDVVIIATPLDSHFKLAKAALNQGKHVLVEKPFVSSSVEAEELIRLAKNKDLTLMIDHTFEYTPEINKIKELIEKNDLGGIYTVDMVRVNLGLFQKNYNVVWDLAYHDVSILLYTLGKMPKNVIAVGQDFIQKGIEDSAYIILKFPRKTLASIHISWLDPNKIRRVTFVGSKKMLVFDDIETTEKIKIFDKGVDIKTKRLPTMKYFESLTEFIYLYRSGDIYIPQLDQTEPLKVMAEHFIEVLMSGGKPRSSGEVGLKIVKVLEAVNKSVKEGGREVKIDD